MAELTIATTDALGPLSIEILGERGQHVGPRTTISSLKRQATVRDLPPGTYMIVATRPSGEQITKDFELHGPSGSVQLTTEGHSPREFLRRAARRGLVPPAFRDPEIDLHHFASSLPQAANATIKTLSALIAGPQIDTRSLAFFMRPENEISIAPRTSRLHLVQWAFKSGRWRRLPHDRLFEVEGGRDYFQVRIESRDRPNGIALGLLDDQGFGPIVMVPPFVAGIDITFLAAGVAMGSGADRVSNPSAVRVPVALAVPRDDRLADLLAGLTAPALPDAMSLWESSSREFGPNEAALQALLHKYRDPVAAILGGLFLARFAPSRLPLEWLRNLYRLRPDIADPALLLAWGRIILGDGGRQWDQSITDLLRHASKRRCLLFARTRAQLTQMTRLYGPFPRARQVDTKYPRHARPGDYLDFAADAGGLEAFWGTSPTRPGYPRSCAPRPRGGIAVEFGESHFEQIFLPAST